MRSLNFRVFLLADFASSCGDWVLWLAVAIWMKQATGSSGAAGAVFFAFALGGLLAPVSGMVADRFRRRGLLIAVNLLTLPALLPLYLVHGPSQAWVCYLVMFCYGVSGSLSGPAQTALLPQLVPPDRLAQANSLRQTLNQCIRLFGPPVGAGLLAFGGIALTVTVDIATFVIGAIALLAVRVDEPPRQRAGRSVFTELTTGTRFLGGDDVLRPIAIALGAVLLVVGFTESFNFSVVTLGLGRPATFLGVLIAAQGAGSLLGGATAGLLGRHLGEPGTIVAGLVAVGGAVALLAVPSVVVVGIGFVVAGVALPWLLVASTTSLQRRAPAEILGRVAGAFDFVLNVPTVISVGLGAMLVAAIDYRIALVVMASVVVSSAGFLFLAVRGRAPMSGQPLVVKETVR